MARTLLAGGDDLAEAPVAFLVPPGLAWVTTQWGIWRAGGIAVPLAVSHPPPELAYVLDDTEPAAVVVHPELRDRIAPAAAERGIRLLPTDGSGEPATSDGPAGSAAGEAGELPVSGSARAPSGPPDLPTVGADRRAMIVYTSGTTGRPKGAVTTHANISAQIVSLVEAWAWTPDDRILLVLPLHHVHGIVNVLGCALWAGACCEIHPRFDPVAVWERFATGGLTLFMAVPTIYARLIAAWEEADGDRRARWSRAARELRLMVSGSAALPVRVLERWREITGHVLLERYGMTEIGMGLANPLEGPRRPGHVGRPLPGVEIRLEGEDGSPVPPGRPGEIQVRGPGVFKEYWQRPRETAAAFLEGWFQTGDLAVVEDGSYRVLGRSSVDIIKTGGEKVSALEVEEALREHPDVLDCAVVGVPDPAWGERVCALVVPADGAAIEADGLREWARGRLAPYKIPSRILRSEALPRNAMGKVTKPAVRALFEGADTTSDGSSEPSRDASVP